MAPPEAEHEGAQGARRLDHAAKNPGGSSRTQPVGVVNAVAASQSGGHQRQQLVAGVGPSGGIAQVNVAVRQFIQAQAQGQSGRQNQPGVGYQAMVVEGDADAVRVVT